MIQLQLRHYVETSTGHLEQSDTEILDREAGRERIQVVPPFSFPFVTYQYPEGYWLCVDFDELEEMGLDEAALQSRLEQSGIKSKALAPLLLAAYKAGAGFLRLDRDADPVDGLPTYDW